MKNVEGAREVETKLRYFRLESDDLVRLERQGIKIDFCGNSAERFTQEWLHDIFQQLMELLVEGETHHEVIIVGRYIVSEAEINTTLFITTNKDVACRWLVKKTQWEELKALIS